MIIKTQVVNLDFVYSADNVVNLLKKQNLPTITQVKSSYSSSPLLLYTTFGVLEGLHTFPCCQVYY